MIVQPFVNHKSNNPAIKKTEFKHNMMYTNLNIKSCDRSIFIDKIDLLCKINADKD